MSEFTAVPAKEAVTFHVLYATEPEALAAEMQAGGAPFACEFYNQVSRALPGSEVWGQFRGLNRDGLKAGGRDWQGTVGGCGPKGCGS